jgi:DNA processing protein
MSTASVVSDEVQLARAYLSRVAEPASLAIWEFVSAYGPVVAAAAIRRGQVPAPVATLTAARRRCDPYADLEAAAHHGIRLISPESPDWPHLAIGALERVALDICARGQRLTSSERYGGEPAPPLALWVKGTGEVSSLGVRGAAIVGARSATAYGEHVAALFGYGLAAKGITVVSGGAYGIDAAAHRAALGAGGATVIVSAGGIDHPYPPGNARLYEQAADGGLVISESPPGSAPHRHRFLSRNRLIASLSTGTVVVEAAVRSGALNTAAHCVTVGRPLMVVPGPVTSALSTGCHRLLRREDYRALLVESVDDVLAVVAGIGEAGDDAGAAGSGETGDTGGPGSDGVRRALEQLDPVARRVFEGLASRTWRTEDQIATTAGIGLVEVLRALPALRLAGLTESDDQGHRLSRGARERR